MPSSSPPLFPLAVERCSLLHSLMPSVFASHVQFRDWFRNPLTGIMLAGGI